MAVDRRLLVVAALGLLGCRSKGVPPPTEDRVRHDAFARNMALDAGAINSFDLSSSDDIHYEWGWSDIEYEPAGNFRGRPFRWFSPHSFVRLRSHGDKPMKIVFNGWVNREVIGMTPTVTISVDGILIASFLAGKDGAFGGMGIVREPLLRDRDWVGLTVEVSSVTYHWAEAPVLKVALSGHLEWAEWVEPPKP